MECTRKVGETQVSVQGWWGGGGSCGDKCIGCNGQLREVSRETSLLQAYYQSNKKKSLMLEC